jgi:hypothetical protein
MVTMSLDAHIKLSTAMHTKSHHFAFLPSHLLLLPFTTRCTAPTPHIMAGEIGQNLPITDEPVASDNKSSSWGGGVTFRVVSSFSNMAAAKIADKTIPDMSDYWKKSTITEEDRKAYHFASWLGGGLESLVPGLDIPTVDGSTIVCFESHLIARLGLPPTKFLVAIMNFLGCELVHLNPNPIAALSCLTMLCECWLGIMLDTSSFWYFYSSARYNKVVFSGIRLSVRCHR